MTLRVRLLLGLVVLAAVGLAGRGRGDVPRAADRILLNRVNEQLASAIASPQLFFRRLRDGGPDADDRRPAAAGNVRGVRFADGTVQLLSDRPGLDRHEAESCPATIDRRQRLHVARSALPRPLGTAPGIQRREPGHRPLSSAQAMLDRRHPVARHGRDACTACCSSSSSSPRGVLLGLVDPRVVGRQARPPSAGADAGNGRCDRGR